MRRHGEDLTAPGMAAGRRRPHHGGARADEIVQDDDNPAFDVANQTVSADDAGSAVGCTDAVGSAAVAPDDGGGLIGEPSDPHPASGSSAMHAATTRLLMVGWYVPRVGQDGPRRGAPALSAPTLRR